jgi:hypothetical protein
VASRGESERRVAEALRAQAGGGQAWPSQGRATHPLSRLRRTPQRPDADRHRIGTALVLALLGGAVLGMALALLSVLVPGLLPVVA